MPFRSGCDWSRGGCDRSAWPLPAGATRCRSGCDPLPGPVRRRRSSRGSRGATHHGDPEAHRVLSAAVTPAGDPRRPSPVRTKFTCSFPPSTSPSSSPWSSRCSGCWCPSPVRGRPSWWWRATCSTRGGTGASSSCSPHRPASPSSAAGWWTGQRGPPRKVALWTTLVLLIGLLAWFKYFGFVAVNVDNATHLLGLGRPIPLLSGHPARRDLLLHLHGHQLRGGHLPRRAAARPWHRRDGLPVVLPPPHRRAHRPRHRTPPADPHHAGPEVRPLRRGLLADRRRTGQEGRPLLLPVDLRRRPGLRRPAPALRPRGAVRHLGLRRPDLRRLQRLHRHRHRPRTPHGLPVPGQLPAPLHGHRPPGLLAAVAHHPVVLAAGLPLHPSRRQSWQPSGVSR